MQVTSAVSVTWIWLLMMGGVGVVPGGPPLPLDPVLSAVAPQECLWYSATSGLGAADPASTNRSEQLFAEPAVERLYAELESQILAAARRGAGEAPDQKVLAAKIPILLKVMMTRPTAAFIEEVQPGPDETVKIEAGFVLNAGDQRTELEDAIKSLMTIAAMKGLATTPESAGGVEWQRVATPPEAPPVRFGWKDDYFLIAVGEATPARVIERMAGAAPAWLADIRAEHPIEREKAIGYLNVAGILERVKPLAMADDPKAWEGIEKLGITQIRAAHGVSGFDAEGCTTMAHIVTAGERPGLLGLLPHEPLAASDLGAVPKDATLALAFRLNPRHALEHFVDLRTQFEPNARSQFEQAMAAAQEQLGINFRENVIGALGDEWVIYLPGGDLMSSWLNAGAAVGVKDAVKLRPALEKLIQIYQGLAVQQAGAAINKSTVGEHTIFTLQINGAPVPVSPSLCLTDERMIIGLSSQAVQAAIDRKPEDSLAAAEPVAAALSGDAPAVLTYIDTPQVVRSLYPLAQMGLMMAGAELQKQGVQINPAIIPPMETIVKHLRPSVATFAHAKDGFHMTSRGTFPGGGNLASSAPVAAAMLLPAIQSARQAARNAQELNSLKQLALAALNYESAMKELPRDIYSDDGKPLLSWRVRVLPYMEQNALYQQFKLDEPWDSANNRPLMEQMPEVFKSPSSGDLGTKTRFVALAGPATLFPGNNRVRLRDVLDGTSNTILFVQANPETAVEWTKPGDIEFDAQQPFAGLATPEGQFLAVFNDGAARPLSLGIGAEVLNALVTRAGKEAIEHKATVAPPAPWLYDTDEPDGVLEPAAVAP